MRKTAISLFLILISVVIITGCNDNSTNFLEPMMGMDWFMEYDEVKTSFSDYTLIEERETKEENETQKMQDYTDVSLFDINCDLTLCFTDSGLIGFNYHDVDKNNKYQEWFTMLEKYYGYPTEEGNGMASWYDNPLGKNTAVYLFNLQEGVQISFYASSNTPDKSYEKQEDVYIPTPEIRTPIIPVEEEKPTVIDENEDVFITTTQQQEKSEIIHITPNIQQNATTQTTDSKMEEEIVVSTTTTNKHETTTSVIMTTSTETTTNVTTVPINLAEEFKLNGLEFYGSPKTECGKMDDYHKTSEYQVNESGTPWKLIVEYDDVLYGGESCNTILCFTSLGLVGINYFDEDASNYSYWVNLMNDTYGQPFDKQYDYTAWYDNLNGTEIMIYVFSLEDGVQISFYADDTGSEIS